MHDTHMGIYRSRRTAHLLLCAGSRTRAGHPNRAGRAGWAVAGGQSRWCNAATTTGGARQGAWRARAGPWLPGGGLIDGHARTAAGTAGQARPGATPSPRPSASAWAYRAIAAPAAGRAGLADRACPGAEPGPGRRRAGLGAARPETALARASRRGSPAGPGAGGPGSRPDRRTRPAGPAGPVGPACPACPVGLARPTACTLGAACASTVAGTGIGRARPPRPGADPGSAGRARGECRQRRDSAAGTGRDRAGA